MIGIAVEVLFFRCSVKKKKVESLATSNVYNDGRLARLLVHGTYQRFLVLLPSAHTHTPSLVHITAGCRLRNSF